MQKQSKQYNKKKITFFSIPFRLLQIGRTEHGLDEHEQGRPRLPRHVALLLAHQTQPRWVQGHAPGRR